MLLLKKTIQLIVLSIAFSISNIQAALVQLDFTGSGGILPDGTSYTLSGGYAPFGNGFQISDQTLVVSFSNPVNLQILPNGLDTAVWNNPADGTVMFDVVGGTLANISDPDDEILSTIGEGTGSLGVNFRYTGAGPTGPNGNDYVAAFQNWIIDGSTASTLTITHNPIIPNSSSFEILAEGTAQVPEPSTCALILTGLLGIGAVWRKRFSSH